MIYLTYTLEEIQIRYIFIKTGIYFNYILYILSAMILSRTTYPNRVPSTIEAPSAFSLPKNIRKTPEYIEIFDTIKTRMNTILDGDMKSRILMYIVHLVYRVRYDVHDNLPAWKDI
jgi:hypothetical protein